MSTMQSCCQTCGKRTQVAGLAHCADHWHPWLHLKRDAPAAWSSIDAVGTGGCKATVAVRLT